MLAQDIWAIRFDFGISTIICSEGATVVDRDDAVVRAEALLARLEQAERDEDDAV